MAENVVKELNNMDLVVSSCYDFSEPLNSLLHAPKRQIFWFLNFI